jgi:hypothetical protein
MRFTPADSKFQNTFQQSKNHKEKKQENPEEEISSRNPI